MSGTTRNPPATTAVRTLNLRPSRCIADLSASSGFVSVLRFALMTAEAAADVGSGCGSAMAKMVPTRRSGILREMTPRGRTADLTTLDGIKSWLRAAVRDYRWNVRGIILDDGKVVPL